MRLGQGAVGVFDSGVGGLSVVRALLDVAPGTRVLYVADQAHVPYGGRPLDEVRGFAEAISRFLADEGCQSVVMACNISSATALASVRQALSPLPVFGMIGGVAHECAASGTESFAVLATEGTVRSGAYGRQIRSLRPDARVVEIPCPRFVPLVEAGDTEGSEAEDAATEYLAPAARVGADAIVLGCTHYPFLRPILERVAASLFPAPPVFIDPAVVVAREVAAGMPRAGGYANSTHDLLTTGCRARFGAQARLFLPGAISRVVGARWTCAGPGGAIKVDVDDWIGTNST